jgi:hypothetical protein
MRLLTFSLLGVVALLGSACSRAPEEARYTVEEYRANAELRQEQIARCRRDPGTLKTTPDCINAQTAAAFEDRLRLREAPPVGLDKSKESTKSADERRQE